MELRAFFRKDLGELQAARAELEAFFRTELEELRALFRKDFGELQSLFRGELSAALSEERQAVTRQLGKMSESLATGLEKNPKPESAAKRQHLAISHEVYISWRPAWGPPPATTRELQWRIFRAAPPRSPISYLLSPH